MANIYNLQQVSQNSRIVAIEGTFDHVDANNLNAANIDISNVTTDKLTLNEIDAVDPLIGVCFNDKILIDEINEKTLNNGVDFPQKIKVDTIEGSSTAFVKINDLRSNIIASETGTDPVEFPSDLKTDVIESLSNTNIQIDRPIALTLSNEYTEVNFEVNNILGADVQWSNVSAVNVGLSPYVPPVAGGNLVFQENGLYHVTISFTVNTGFTSDQILFARFRDPSISGTDHQLTTIVEGGGAPGGTTSFTWSGIIKPLGVSPVSNNYGITIIQLGIINSISGTGNLIVTRIK